MSAVYLNNVGPTHTDYQVNLVVTGTSAGTYLMSEATTAGERNNLDVITINSSAQVQMTEGDVAQLQVTVGPAGQPKVIGVNGGTDTQSGYFTGCIIQQPSTGVSWQVISASQGTASNKGYICAAPGGALNLALPVVSSVGDILEVNLRGATSWKITQGIGQQIFIGNTNTTLGGAGYLMSTAQGNSVRMVCSVISTAWDVLSSIGNITVN